MSHLGQKIRFFRQRIPSFECIPGCHDCCGPVTTSTEEIARLPVKSEAEHTAAMENLSCPHLGEKGCQVYAERPLICRLFGTTPRLLCPNGRKPELMIEPRVEESIFMFFAETRHVLV
jgi:Fe-S-cluster containining protein